MRFGLIDLLLVIVLLIGGAGIGEHFTGEAHGFIRVVVPWFFGAIFYLVLAHPFYRMFRLPPLMLPTCPCCNKRQLGFHIQNVEWPRVTTKCPTCNGQFVVWYNSKPSPTETWSLPVLAVKWPYVYGPYKKMNKPEPHAVGDSSTGSKRGS